MKFEERIGILCARALALDDCIELQEVLSELRSLLHEHVEQLRNNLVAAYSKSLGKLGHHEYAIGSATTVQRENNLAPSRTWQQIIHDLACETDRVKALQLSQELDRLMQRTRAA